MDQKLMCRCTTRSNARTSAAPSKLTSSSRSDSTCSTKRKVAPMSRCRYIMKERKKANQSNRSLVRSISRLMNTTMLSTPGENSLLSLDSVALSWSIEPSSVQSNVSLRSSASTWLENGPSGSRRDKSSSAPSLRSPTTTASPYTSTFTSSATNVNWTSPRVVSTKR